MTHDPPKHRLNRLAAAQSPYLLQHQANPVDWFPWGEEAFEKARSEDRPIFLSIGYSACHWCHVMERESFEDGDVARLLNEGFVSVKVDREERPDVDHVYMAVCQAMTGQGGWPLTIIMTPDGKPFFAGTYLPKHGRYGRPGMMELLPRIRAAWEEQRDDVLATAEHIAAAMQTAEQTPSEPAEPAPAWLRLGYEQLAQRFDARHGGFGEAPKFPTPHHLLFLLRYGYRTGEEDAFRMAADTLDAMRRGGVYDQLGHGFHRYSTDAVWRLPHFEKMLYDQALLAMAYTEAAQALDRPDFGTTARDILSYVLRDLRAPEGGFYAAEDADSEGQEGKFYVWTEAELQALLGDEAALFSAAHGVQPDGNFLEEATRSKTGENVLYVAAPASALAERFGLAEEEVQRKLAAARARLFEHRQARVRPSLDDKILTDWNGLMIAALAKAAWVLDEPAYAEAAARAADFILGTLRTEEGRLLHRYRAGTAGITAHADDYAFLIWGLIELYQASFEVRWLQAALALNEALLTQYWDDAAGGLFFTAEDGEALLVRPKEYYDGALPSANAVTLLNLVRLARLTGRTELEEKAAAIGRSAAALVRRFPSGFTMLLTGLAFAMDEGYEVVIAGERDRADTQALLAALRGTYVPHQVVVLRGLETAEEDLVECAPYVAEQHALNERATAYVCQAYRCHQPTTEPAVMLQLLRS